ncbi:metallophosphoesterase [Siculibacillus lacustris]|uniref:Metallophosphoesterase n=1 Tax=Siculibacillus lacustris TaxID=1549641 RepID=A0A4Q9VH83_9HYPH|nr:metallophosphoesterase [Siculibacillus lacustris]TBW33576.1 metallophosphoesterase [Siculibacillus lacustris]
MAFRVIQVSDTHLSTVHRQFAENVAAVGRHIAASGADLVINTGDLTMNGAGDPADLALAADWHRDLGIDWRAVPGNHDVGDLLSIRADQPIGAARLAAYRAAIGDDRWSLDIDGWRLIGLDAMLFGSGDPEEEAQYRWFDEATETTAKIALFLHKPLFIDEVSEGARGYWTVKPEPRARLLAALQGADLGLVASGHLHVSRIRAVDGVAHVWGPSAAFVCGAIQEELGGARSVGVIEHRFTADAVESRFVRPRAVEDSLLDPVHDEIYPPSAKPVG